MVRFTASAILGLSAGLIGLTVAQDFPACDADATATQTSKGVGMPFTTDDPTFFLGTGLGSCGFNYTNEDAVACLAPGWIGSARTSRCNSWVTLTLPDTGRTTAARVLDTCGAVANSTFGCNDVYVSLSVFNTLAGDKQAAALDAGRLPGPVVWSFTDEPCYACVMGLPGKTPDGKTDDTCQGFDASGYLRCGRKTGSGVVALGDVDKFCNHQVCDCDGGSGAGGAGGDTGGSGDDAGSGSGDCHDCEDPNGGSGLSITIGNAKLLKKRRV